VVLLMSLMGLLILGLGLVGIEGCLDFPGLSLAFRTDGKTYHSSARAGLEANGLISVKSALASSCLLKDNGGVAFIGVSHSARRLQGWLPFFLVFCAVGVVIFHIPHFLAPLADLI
jgi:hypothetical protein